MRRRSIELAEEWRGAQAGEQFRLDALLQLASAEAEDADAEACEAARKKQQLQLLLPV
jgi:hypothetical protein